MLKTHEIQTLSEEQTIELGCRIGRVLEPCDVVLLEGDLGTGKTRLAKGIVAAATGVSQDDVVSPTFTLINRFDGDPPVHHADLYRISADQVHGIGLEDALDERGALVVEWADKLVDFAEDHLRILILFAEEENARRIILEWSEHGPWANKLDAAAFPEE